MDRLRLITTSIVLYIYLMIVYPLQTILVSIILVLTYFALRSLKTKNTISRGNEEHRRNALKIASIYLAPYNNIWGNLKLSNKYCSLKLGFNGSSITARDKRNPKRSFRVIGSKVHSYNDLWDMYCLSFSHNTTFDELVQMTNTFNAFISLSEETKTTGQNKQPAYNSNINKTETYEIKELLDVNNASEIELTALPGISIVMAKKLIKKREEIDGFKSVEDVFLFLKLKPHMQNQLEQLICVKKMKGRIGIKRFSERSVDI